jgi:hypothetical protein
MIKKSIKLFFYLLYNIVSYSGGWSKKKTYFADHSISEKKKKKQFYQQ